MKKLVFVYLLLLFAILFLGSMLPQVVPVPDKRVKQAVLLIKQSTQTSASVLFPTVVADRMNISYTVFDANSAFLGRSVLYDGEVGKFSLIAVTSEAMRLNLNDTEVTLLDNYEEEFGVAEVLLGPVTLRIMERYGVSSLSTVSRFNSLKWTNGLINFMNTTMSNTALEAGTTTVYAYGGNETQTNPTIWSYSTGNKVRVASSVRSSYPYAGDTLGYWGTFWLGARLSPANKILKFFWSIDIDDINAYWSDNGIYGAPAVENLYLNGNDVEYMISNLVTPLDFNPTLAVEYSNQENTNMTTASLSLYDTLTPNKEKFDFVPHTELLTDLTYSIAMNRISADRSAISRWGFLPTLYYIVPIEHNYSRVGAVAMTDSSVWYVPQEYSATTNIVTHLKQRLSDFDYSSPTLFRVARRTWIPWNLRTTSQILNYSGQASWDKYWLYYFENDLFSESSYAQYYGGFRIEMTHFENFVYDRESADAPALTLIRNASSIGVIPVVPTRSWALAENFYFIRNFKFNATYNINQNTLTYDILKTNADARNRVTIVFEGKVRPLNFYPMILKYDQESTIVTLNYQKSITLRLGEQETTNPYIINYETSLLIAASFISDTLSFTVSAPNGAVSVTRVFTGNKGGPKSINGASGWSYDVSTNILTITKLHTSQASITVIW